MLKSQYLSGQLTVQTFYTDVKMTLISTFEKCRFLDSNTVRNIHSRRIHRNDDNLRPQVCIVNAFHIVGILVRKYF
jgi:hypothetical protein